jgi:hypothetical protein
MTTTKDTRPKPANAGAITRILVKAGMDKGARHTTSVPGYHTFTRGVVSSQQMKYGFTKVRSGTYADGSPRYTNVSNNEPTGYVTVEWQLGDWARERSAVDRATATVEQMRKAAAILRDKGYQVRENIVASSAEMTLSVWREDVDGQVVTW